MYSFIKNTLSSALGVILAIGVLGVIGFIFLIGAAASSSETTSIKNKSILYIPLNGMMQEQAVDDPISDFIGSQQSGLGLNQLCHAIEKAKDMKEIKGIYLEAGLLQSDPASLQELRKYLEDFKKSGKFILAYGNNYTQGGYYLCSVANKVALNPVGMVDWKGLASQPIFFKDMLAKFGVKMQVFKVGTFKSAVEPFTSTEMSAANRQQVTSYLGSIWNNFVNSVAVSRKISKDSLMAYADRFAGFASATDLVKKHMVDTLTYIDGAKQMLKTYSGVDADKTLNMVSAADVCAADGGNSKSSKNKIAVYYAAGDIVDADVQGYSNESVISAPSVIKDLEKLQNDKHVKAVVMRINSGGGSAYASEQIWHAMKELGKKKPLIVSMGGLAASGAYYMSSASQYIFAEPTTLTGSIGIFGMFPDFSTLLNDKLGIKFDEVKTNKLSDFGTISRPLNAEESQLLQAYIEKGYALFVSRVAKGRNKTPQQVDAIGQGRVWTGEQAITNGLVDRLGTLHDAIAFAAQKAGLGNDFESEDYPTPEPWYMSFLQNKKDEYYDTKMQAMLGQYYHPFLLLKTLTQRSYIQARIPYSPNIY